VIKIKKKRGFNVDFVQFPDDEELQRKHEGE